jgi:hypothetical protein
MICLPPTSIALSESDIDSHLREIEIKEQLYAQGFTREEVQRYYGERHGSDVDDDDVLSTRPASVAMANAREDSARGAKPLVVKEERCRPSGTSDPDMTGHQSDQRPQTKCQLGESPSAKMAEAGRNHHLHTQVQHHRLPCQYRLLRL